jgi:membrane associated rhomboid family serine protease
MFGEIIEGFFVNDIFGEKGKLIFLILYISSLFVCLLPTYLNNQNNYYYKSLGASGAVSAVVFAYIFLQPMQGIGLIFIPFLHAPAFIFGIVYLGVSAYLSKRGGSHINHSAHFWGAIYGIVFLIVVCQFMSAFRPIDNFIYQIKTYFQ